ncbi:MAG: undecaprenyl-diphosphate phosphatase [Candidatus Bathyarchaeia archaeon]
METAVLGTIQGLTEWLPISSTGHLKVAEHFLHFLDTQDSLLFEFMLHIGTLLVVLFFFREDIKKIIAALVHLDFKTEHGKLLPSIIVGTIPAVAVGVLLKEPVEQAFQNLLPIAVAFVVFGLVLYLSKMGKEEKDGIDYLTAVIVGVAEGLAIIPGVSRSGATIAIALLLGIKREKAFKFSFLLSIPAIIGAIGYTAYKDYGALATAGLGWTEILVGVVAAMIVGYLTIKLLWKILAQKKFHFFALYCWLFGIALIALSLSGF